MEHQAEIDMEEGKDALMPLNDDTVNVLQQLSIEISINPSKFASFWEMDEEDIEEPSPEDIQANPELRMLWAAENGELAVIEELLQTNRQLVNGQDSDGYTPLHRAAYEGRVDVIQKLLSSGADISMRTNDGWTALHSASVWGQYKAAQELLNLGADINAQTKGLQTALHLAASSTHSQSKPTLEVLLMHPDVDYALRNKLGETAQVVANRCSKYACLFEMCEDSVNKISNESSHPS